MKRQSLVSSFRCAFEGIGYVLRTQRNCRIQLLMAFVALALGLILGLSALEMAVLLLTVAAVIAAEMLNTAAETAVDMVTDEYHPLAKIAKDVAAGAVLVLAINAVVVAFLLFVPHLVRLWPN